MPFRQIVTVIFVATCILPYCGRCQADTRPNVIFILCDDMGYSDVGCYGGEVDTPNIDSLAAGGIRFTQMHNTSKCFPSRACLLTGLYAQQCGMDRGPGKISDNAITLGELMRSAGYRTLAAGKHHSTESLYERGFDRWFGLRDGACNYFNPGHPRDGEGIPSQKKPGARFWCIDDKTVQGYTPPEKDFYTTDYFTNYAISYLDEYKSESKPFFLYLAYNAPHDPLQAWPQDIAKYKGRYDAGYEAIRQARFAKQKQLGIVTDAYPLSDAEAADDPNAEELRKMEVYAAMIDRVDQNIGRLIAKLKALNKFDNTLILFASDNGSSAENAHGSTNSGEIGSMTRWASLGGKWANVSNTPYRKFKNYSHEGGICTPFIAHWPKGITARGSIDHDTVGHVIDVMPTLAEIAKTQYPAQYNGHAITPAQGTSLLPVLAGTGKISRTAPIFWQWSSGAAIRDGKWKLVRFGKSGWELYDMSADVTETHDLSAQHPEKVSDMTKSFESWQQAVNGKEK